MSMHKMPLTDLEHAGLINHGLDVGKPSQLSDAFRHGMKWAIDNVGIKWISVENKTPEHEPGKWSDPVIAMSDIGLVFRLSYCGGWQRTGDFMSTGSSKVTHWIPMPKFAEDDNVS